MKEIELSQGEVAIVDDADYPLVADFKWCYRAERDGRQGYAVRHKKIDGKPKMCYLHREIMPAPPGHEVIFLNHDRLDCRRENLKVMTKQEARQHHRVRRDSKSGVKGVRCNLDTGMWSAYVCRNGRYHSVGTYYTREAAREAYEAALDRESPELHRAPKKVERTGNAAPIQRGNPDRR